MCELFGLCANCVVSVCFTWRGFLRRGEFHYHDWGVAWYFDGCVGLVKEPRPSHKSSIARLLLNGVKGRIVISHVRFASCGELSYVNTHPFVRRLYEWDWVFAHNGDVSGIMDDLEFKLKYGYPMPEDENNPQVIKFQFDSYNEYIKRVKKEGQALRTVSRFNSDTFRTPDLLFDCERDGMRFLGMSAVPRNSRPVHRLSPAILRFLASLQRDGKMPVTNSPYWEELRRLVSAYVGSSKATIEAAFAKAEKILDGVEIDFGWCHGDFAPWNVRRYGDKFFVMDWEMLHKGFALIDACFFVVQREIFIKHRSPYDIWRQLFIGCEMAMTRQTLYPNLEDAVFGALVMVGLIDYEVRRAHFFKDYKQEPPSPSVRSEILKIWLKSG